MMDFILPQTQDELTRFYFFTCACYLLVHLLWDFFSIETPAFSLRELQNKLSEVYASSTFATSLFFMIMIIQPKNPLRNTDAVVFPLILASITGLFISMSALQPKKK